MTALGNTQKLAIALADLAEIVDKRADKPKKNSYTSKILDKGKGYCAKKIGEEGVELALAIVSEKPSSVAGETADLLFHLFVGLRSRGIELDAIADALAARRGTSGLTEKANRKS